MLFFLLAMSPADGPALSPAVQAYLTARAAETDQIDPLRRQDLDRLAAYIRSRRAAGAVPQLLFVCTHNSRRSHLAQVWAEVIGRQLGLPIVSHSAGTEATAFNPRAVAALERAGLVMSKAFSQLPGGPRYKAIYGEGLTLTDLHSKTLAQSGAVAPFAAVMVCSDADKRCPFVPGAEVRIAIAYEDPKAADGTPDEAATYDARCAQIARELHYALSRAAQ